MLLVLAGTINTQMTLDGKGNVGVDETSPTEKIALSEGNFLQIADDPKHVGAVADDETTVLVGAVATDSLAVSDHAQLGNSQTVGGGVNVGLGGAKSDGPSNFSHPHPAQ